jgi:hypothetical protein
LFFNERKKMITEFRQKINYAEIQGIRNYSTFEGNQHRGWFSSFNTSSHRLIEHDISKTNIFSQNVNSEKTSYDGLIVTLPDVIHKNKCYFTKTHNGVSERFDVKFYKEGRKTSTYYTDKDHQIRRHYGNPFSTIRIKYVDKSITKTDEKISLRLFEQTKIRSFNSRFYKVSKQKKTLSINLKTGDITVGYKVFRKNSFKMIYMFLHEFFMDTVSKNEIGDFNFQQKMSNKMDPYILLTKFKETLGDNGEINRYDNKVYHRHAFEMLINLFVNKKKIKIPNGGVETLLTDYYPTEKFFKKNDRKLISSVLDMFGLKSKVLIKILHQHENVNHKNLFLLCKMLGDNYSKYVGSIKHDAFVSKNITRSLISPMDHEGGKYIVREFNPTYTFTEIEKQNVISLINDMDGEFFNDMKMILFNDHLDMINSVRRFDPTIYFKSKTSNQFKNSHSELSSIISNIKRGWSIKYTFNEQMVEDVEDPITITVDNTSFELDLMHITPSSVSVTFYPHILKREEDYDEEGSFMHHCVASYSKKDKSIIISVRTKDQSDRVTCEYNCQDGKLIQARSFHNAVPPADIAYAIETLTKKVVKYSKLGMLHAVNKEKVPFKINGIEVDIETPSIPSFLEIGNYWNF